MSTDFPALFRALSSHQVQCVLVGGMAGTVHGSARSTYDVDLVYSRSSDNLERVVEALRPFAPYLRGAPENLPFQLDLETMRKGLNFTLVTSIGPVDLLGEIAGGGTFESLLKDSIEIEIFGSTCRCVSLRRLIDLKRAAGRPRDLEAIAELQAIAEEQSPDNR